MCRYERAIADLRRQLAQAGQGDAFSTPVVKLLQSLVDDGFVEANVDLLGVEEQWKEHFTEDDIAKMLNAPEYEMLLRRYGGNPVRRRHATRVAAAAAAAAAAARDRHAKRRKT